MIPVWKLRRELSRLGQHLRAIPEAIWEPAARRRHDARVAAGLPVTVGAQAPAAKVALFVLFQPQGVADSTLDTCRHLARHGYAVMIVSNAPLSADDRARLAPLVWRIVERPNFGYDFGGYRDGLHLLRAWDQRPDRVVVLNDSVWFPLRDDDTLLARAEAAPQDITGLVMRHKGSTRFLESYFFAIRGPVLDHPGFRDYWHRLRLTSNKFKVIRRGERGFGMAMTAAGLTMGALFDGAAVRAALVADAGLLRDALRFAAHADAALQDRARALARDHGPGWSDRALPVVAALLDRGQIYSTLPVAAVRLAGYPVMKKSAEPVSARWRAAWLEAVDAGALPPPPPSVLAEARARGKDARP